MRKTQELICSALYEAPIVAHQRESIYTILMILVYKGLATVKKTHASAAEFARIL